MNTNSRAAVRNTAGAGAGLFALTDFFVGELVLREAPFACVPAYGGAGGDGDLRRIVEDLEDGAKRTF